MLAAVCANGDHHHTDHHKRRKPGDCGSLREGGQADCGGDGRQRAGDGGCSELLRGISAGAKIDHRPASELTPQELERWLREHCKTPATANRYKAFISLCYRVGVRNGKAAVNPARLVRQRKEGTGQLRFLTREEYDRLRAVISRRFAGTATQQPSGAAARQKRPTAIRTATRRKIPPKTGRHFIV